MEAGSLAEQAAKTTWTTRDLIGWMTEAFGKAGVDSGRHCAELLLAHVIGCERMRLYMETDRPASPLELSQLRELAGRALKHEPVQYLVEEAWFFTLPMFVDRRVLIPRPSTETIGELVMQHARLHPGFERGVYADVCAGSGCLGIAMLKHLPGAHVLACDISGEALEVAAINAERHGVADRIEMLEGDLLGPLLEHGSGRELHYLMANPPYIPDREWGEVAANVKDHEPGLALRGGVDGLKFVGPLVEDGPGRLRSGGLLLIEIASATAGEVLELAKEHAELVDARIEDDFEGLARVLVAVKR